MFTTIIIGAVVGAAIVAARKLRNNKVAVLYGEKATDVQVAASKAISAAVTAQQQSHVKAVYIGVVVCSIFAGPWALISLAFYELAITAIDFSVTKYANGKIDAVLA